jgi:oxygen-independent coproporphyrinogen-3 oxidase
MDAYVDACVTDIRRRALPRATSVFFGGGTPSLLPADHLVGILDAIDRAPGAEVTVECNPDSVDAEKLRRYVHAGVSRISLGVQSMIPRVLRALGRTHDPDNVARAIGHARDAGITRINVDLIYGTPGESLADWQRSLDAVLAFDVPHVSAYALTVEPATPLGRAVAAGIRAAPDDDHQADAYTLADRALTGGGLDWYEVSNWAAAGEECRHNLLYWTEGEYAGIGCAAHGHTDGRRWWNVRTPDRYIAAIGDGLSPEAGHESLDPVRRAEESFALGLRTRAGVVVDGGAELVEELISLRLLERRGDRIALTRAGRLLASDVTARLLIALFPDAVGTRYD